MFRLNINALSVLNMPRVLPDRPPPDGDSSHESSDQETDSELEIAKEDSKANSTFCLAKNQEGKGQSPPGEKATEPLNSVHQASKQDMLKARPQSIMMRQTDWHSVATRFLATLAWLTLREEGTVHIVRATAMITAVIQKIQQMDTQYLVQRDIYLDFLHQVDSQFLAVCGT